MHLNKTLVTGISSGLGKYIHENTKDSIGVNRDNSEKIVRDHKDDFFETIIHCAFNSSSDVSDYKSYVEDNVFFTAKLADIKCRKFIYISSVNVYSEEDNYYSLSKRIGEYIVKSRQPDSHLIIRCSAILGPTIRPNSLVKILKHKAPKLTLSGDSTFNYVLQKDILKFIKHSDEASLFGTLDFTSESDVDLKYVAEKYNKETIFGEYKYETPRSNTVKVYQVSRQFKKSSKDIIEEYIND